MENTERRLHNMLNLYSDFKHLSTNEKNIFYWSVKEDKEFIKTVTDNEYDMFIKHGYFIHDGELCWSISGN